MAIRLAIKFFGGGGEEGRGLGAVDLDDGGGRWLGRGLSKGGEKGQ
jgi:hypothetical protein